MGSRGPYDLCSGERIPSNKWDIANSHMAPGKFEIQPFTAILEGIIIIYIIVYNVPVDKYITNRILSPLCPLLCIIDNHHRRQGKFSILPQYPVPPTERIFCSTLSQWPRSKVCTDTKYKPLLHPINVSLAGLLFIVVEQLLLLFMITFKCREYDENNYHAVHENMLFITFHSITTVIILFFMYNTMQLASMFCSFLYIRMNQALVCTASDPRSPLPRPPHTPLIRQLQGSENL